MSAISSHASRQWAFLDHLPRTGQVFASALVCLALAAVLPAPVVRLGLVLCAGILGLVALVVFGLRRWRRYTAQSKQAWAHRLMATETTAGFVTDSKGIVRFANRFACDEYPDILNKPLSAVFADVLANPQAVLCNLVKQAATTGAGADDIVTRSGHLRIRVLVMAHDCQLWWLDDVADATGHVGHKGAVNSTPHAVLDATGRILERNDAMRQLVGEKAHALEDLVRDLPLRSGQVHWLNTQSGPARWILVETPRSDNRTALFVLPGAEYVHKAPQLEAGWDAIEDLPVPLLDIATDGRLLGSNREARQLLAVQSTDGRKLSDVLDGPGRPINDWLAEAVAGHGGHVSEFLRGKGENQDTFVQVTLSRASTTQDMHLIAVLNDVTELKTLEAQFVQSQKMQAIGQLAGGVAHDFNNLLTAISGHCDLLLLRHDEGDQDYGDLIQIHQNANRAASLVGQLLAFSRKQNLQMETLDLRDTLSDLTHLLNRLVGEKITLLLEHDSALSRIRADKRQLEQVFMNLVVNARDAMPTGGNIRVVTSNVSLATDMRRERAVVPSGDYVVVQVVDEGEGIFPEKLPKIFEPFYTTKGLGEGTGLGLSTAYGIVKQTGGYIFAESLRGSGSTFSLYFPQYEPREEAIAIAVPKKAQALQGPADGVVLLVEDEAPVRAFASRALRLKGFTVLEADSAETALEMLGDAELEVDIFVTDVIMPGLDGPTWVRQALRDRPATKVVFVSGYPEDAFDDGEPPIPDAVFLPKPFSLTDLTQTVQQQVQPQVEPA
ncbi:MAG: ATP-binding protein [Yoonia sp.]|uniref:ATP-binding protein n=1 Tax=Yoonia sp. TaxID=2212373 RepID=UPI003EF75BC2